VVTCEIKHWNNFRTISKWFYVACNNGFRNTDRQRRSRPLIVGTVNKSSLVIVLNFLNIHLLEFPIVCTLILLWCLRPS